MENAEIEHWVAIFAYMPSAEYALDSLERDLPVGEEALDLVFADANRGNLRRTLLILLDLNLPKTSGLEFLRRIKAAEQTQDIPVIILTLSIRDRDIAECRKLGVENYIVKPVDFQNFSEVTARLGLAWTLGKNRSGNGD